MKRLLSFVPAAALPRTWVLLEALLELPTTPPGKASGRRSSRSTAMRTT